MAAETRVIFMIIGVLWLLWDTARTLKRIEQKMDSNEEIISDIRFITKTIGKHFLPSDK